MGPSVGADIIKCNPECGSSAPHHNQLRGVSGAQGLPALFVTPSACLPGTFHFILRGGLFGGGFRSSRAWGFSTLTFLPAKPNLACSVAYPSRRMSVAELSFPSAAFFPPLLGYLQIHGHISLSGRALNLALLWVPC